MRPLTTRQIKFVGEYVAGKSASEAARIAGYSHAYNVDQLLAVPAVKAAIDDARAKLQAKCDYTIEKAFEDLETLIDEARKAKQYSAVAKLNEAKLKMYGFLDEKLRLIHETAPSLVQAMAEARTRIGRYHLEAVDVPATPAPAVALPRYDGIFE
jgi:phage terminase small subunit